MSLVPAVILATVIGCGGKTSTGTARNIDFGAGGDAPVGRFDAGTISIGGKSPIGGCPPNAPTTGESCNGSHAGSCYYGDTTCQCIDPGQNSAFWSCSTRGEGGAAGTDAGSGSGGIVGTGGVSIGTGGSSPLGCCQVDLDCGDAFYVPCVNGVCKNPVGGRCWANGECRGGDSCIGAFVCDCAAQCDQADYPGICGRASDAGTVDGSVPPVDCATSQTCPSESCERVCCPGGIECAPCCVPKSCEAYEPQQCPFFRCQLLSDCTGAPSCREPFTSPQPSCGTISYYGSAPCCIGLVKRCGLPMSDGSCNSTAGGVNGFPTCLACGDGICDSLENRCNCPEDCQ
jgi:hypothetical protein